MRRTLAAFFALVCLYCASPRAQAQLGDKVVPHFGFSYEFLTLTPKYNGSSSLLNFYGLNLGLNYVLTHSNDMFSLGINPNGTGAFAFSSYGSTLFLQAPVFLLGRIGAGATPYNESRFGVGAGVGLKYSYFRQSQSIDPFKETWINPAAIAELSINSRASAYTVRFSWSLMRAEREYDNVPYEWGSTSLSLVYLF